VGLCRTTLEVGAFLDGERSVMNIASDMRLRPQHHVAALNGPLYSTVHHHLLSSDASDDLGLRRHNERSAMQVTFYLTIDLD
jgi:hypothetical protein